MDGHLSTENSIFSPPLSSPPSRCYRDVPGDAAYLLAAKLVAAHRAASAIAAMSRVAELIPQVLSCSDSRDSSLFARGGLGSGE